MPRKTELSIETRAAIVAEYNNGISAVELSKKYKCHKRTIFYQINKHKKNKTVVNTPGRGRKPVTSNVDDRALIRYVKSNPAVTIQNVYNQINKFRSNKISKTTIRRRLHERNIKTFVVRKQPHISEKNRRLRLQFALDHVNKPIEFWRSILWTDETAISFDGTYGKHFYRSDPKEKRFREIVQHTRHSKGGKIIIWGCISYNGAGPIVKCPEKMTSPHYLAILHEYAIPAGDGLIGTHFVLQQDNAPIHTSNMIKTFISGIPLNVLKWPPQSPDLNPIENVWHKLKSMISEEVGRSQDKVWQDAQTAWEAISPQIIRNCIDSVPRRLRAVIDSKGGNTKY